MNPGQRKRNIRQLWKSSKNDRPFPVGTELRHAGKALVVDARGSIFLGGIFERIMEEHVIDVGPGHNHPMSDGFTFELNADHRDGIPPHRHPFREVVGAVSANMDRDAALACFGEISLLENLHHPPPRRLVKRETEEKADMAHDYEGCEARRLRANARPAGPQPS